MWSRIHLVPLLLAEGDRDAHRRQLAADGREREIMKDVKGWEVSAGAEQLGLGKGEGRLMIFSRLANQFTTTPDMRPWTKLLFCRNKIRKIKIITVVEMLRWRLRITARA